MSVIMLVLLLVILPSGLGLCFLTDAETGVQGLLRSWIYGIAFTFGLFELLYIPAFFMKLSFKRLTIGFFAVLVVFFVAETIVLRRRWIAFGKNIVKGHMSLLLIAALITSAALTFVPAIYTNSDDDDAFYVATATTAQETNTLFEYNAYTGRKIRNVQSRYVLSPFPVYLAGISSVSHVAAAELAHRWFPLFMIPASLGVLYLFGVQFYPEDRKKRHLFFLLAVLLTLFSGYSIKNASVFLLYRIWQGKAVLAAFLLPLIWFVFLEQIKDGQKKENAWWNRIRFSILLMMLASASGMVSSMGIFLAPLLIGFLALLLGYRKRSIKAVIQVVLCAWPSVLLGVLYLTVLS